MEKEDEKINWSVRRWEGDICEAKKRKGNSLESLTLAFFPFWREIMLDYQISRKRCVVNHCIWEEQWHLPHCDFHSFLRAFLFWGVLMNDLKSDLFPSLGCLEGRRLAGGGVWRGEVDLDVKVSRLSREHKRLHRCSPRHTSNVDRKYFIYEIKCNALCFHEAGSVLTKGEGHVMHSVVVVWTGE